LSDCSFSASDADQRTATHPCYSGQAHHFFARMHLAVAPACNIQCNYCNRKYDCANETRPGVTSQRLKPKDALRKVYHAARRLKELSVIGIAGPGDALASPARTFETLSQIRDNFPDLTLCLSTNGLALTDNAEELVRLGVGHVTVTLNTFSPETAMKIYAWVLMGGKKASGLLAMDWFLRRQQEGIKELVARGVLVKVNTVLIPGLNDEELPLLSKKLKLMGVFLHNIMPLIARPEHGTAFGLQGRPEPTPQLLERVREECGGITQMAHCRQCRADAVGKLGEDVSSLDAAALAEDCERESGAEKRAKWKEEVSKLSARNETASSVPVARCEMLVAVTTKGNGIVNEHFGHAREFHIYRVENGAARLVNVRRVERQFCEGPSTCGDTDATDEVFNTIADCAAVVCLKVGYGAHKRLEEQGILPVVDLPYEPLERAVLEAARRAHTRKSRKTTVREGAQSL